MLKRNQRKGTGISVSRSFRETHPVSAARRIRLIEHFAQQPVLEAVVFRKRTVKFDAGLHRLEHGILRRPVAFDARVLRVGVLHGILVCCRLAHGFRNRGDLLCDRTWM